MELPRNLELSEIKVKVKTASPWLTNHTEPDIAYHPQRLRCLLLLDPPKYQVLRDITIKCHLNSLYILSITLVSGISGTSPPEQEIGFPRHTPL